MTTLFEATLELARILTDVVESAATGGSTTTVVDTYLHQRAGWFSEAPFGTLWLKLATPASKVITGHAGNTLTFSPAQAGAVVANDRYAAAPGVYPKRALIQSINAALNEIGRVPYEKNVTPVAGQTAYTSTDDAAFKEEVIGVELSHAAAAPYYWTPHNRWHQNLTSAGVYTLYFDEGTEPANTHPMKIMYLAPHTEVKADADIVHAAIHPDRLKWQAAVHALRWRYQRTKQDDPSAIALLNEGKERVAAVAGEQLAEARASIANEAQQELQHAQQMADKMAELYPVIRRTSVRYSRW